MPKEFIKSLKDNYDETLQQAYLNGEFVNLSLERTYYSFNRENNVKKTNYDKYRPIKVGMDFNVNPITCVLLHEYNEHPKIRVFDEISISHSGGKELMTQQICNEIIRRYPNNNNIIVYPDPAGRQKRTSAFSTDHEILRENGFRILSKNVAPSVIDRVNSVNNILKTTIIDPCCKGLIRDLEQVSNKEGTREIDKSNKISCSGCCPRSEYSASSSSIVTTFCKQW